MKTWRRAAREPPLTIAFIRRRIRQDAILHRTSLTELLQSANWTLVRVPVTPFTKELKCLAIPESIG